VSAYRVTLSGLVCGTSSEQVRAKTLYNMLFIFLFFYWFVIDYLVLVSVFILGCKDRNYFGIIWGRDGGNYLSLIE